MGAARAADAVVDLKIFPIPNPFARKEPTVLRIRPEV